MIWVYSCFDTVACGSRYAVLHPTGVFTLEQKRLRQRIYVFTTNSTASKKKRTRQRICGLIYIYIYVIPNSIATLVLGGSGHLHNDPSKGSLLEHILNHTGSEQCWAPMFVKPDSSSFQGDLGTCTKSLPRGHFWSTF